MLLPAHSTFFFFLFGSLFAETAGGGGNHSDMCTVFVTHNRPEVLSEGLSLYLSEVIDAPDVMISIDSSDASIVRRVREIGKQYNVKVVHTGKPPFTSEQAVGWHIMTAISNTFDYFIECKYVAVVSCENVHVIEIFNFSNFASYFSLLLSLVFFDFPDIY